MASIAEKCVGAEQMENEDVRLPLFLRIGSQVFYLRVVYTHDIVTY